MTASERAKQFFKGKWNFEELISKTTPIQFSISDKQIDFLTTATSELSGRSSWDQAYLRST